ncbi:MAG: hypothetical protein H0X28_12225, partial [Solirubrobacterales bacterium]|nr:hypothetical protein [Solirubrobacterales bacterium]
MSDRLLVGIGAAACARHLRLHGDRGPQLLELGDANQEILALLGAQFLHREGQGDVELQDGVAQAAMVEIGARAQRELLSHQR